MHVAITYFSPLGSLVTDMLLWGAGFFLVLWGTVVNTDFQPSAGEEWFLAPGFELQHTTPSRRAHLNLLRNTAKFAIFIIIGILLLFSFDALSQQPILNASAKVSAVSGFFQ